MSFEITTEIPDRYMSNVRLRFFAVPETVTRIGKEAFLNSHIDKIYIPKSVIVIERDAFKGCGDSEIFCEDEPKEGWVYGVRTETVSYDVVTPEDYAFNFHRGPMSSTRVYREVESFHDWNPDKLVVHTHVPSAVAEEWKRIDAEEKAAEEAARLLREEEERRTDRTIRLFYDADERFCLLERRVKEFFRTHAKYRKFRNSVEWAGEDGEPYYSHNSNPAIFCGLKKIYEAAPDDDLDKFIQGLAAACQAADAPAD